MLRLPPSRHVLADRDDVRDVVVVGAHRNLGDAVVARLTGRLGVHLHLLDLAGREDAIELELEQLAWLAVEHLEDFAAQRILARHALRAGLTLAIPGADPVATIDHVQPHRQ